MISPLTCVFIAVHVSGVKCRVTATCAYKSKRNVSCDECCMHLMFELHT